MKKKNIKRRLASLALCMAMALTLHTPAEISLYKAAYAAEEDLLMEAPLPEEDFAAMGAALPEEDYTVMEAAMPEDYTIDEAPLPEDYAPVEAPLPEEDYTFVEAPLPEDFVPVEEPVETEEPIEEEPAAEDSILTATDPVTGTSVIIRGQLPEGAYATIAQAEVPQLMMEVLTLSLTEEEAQAQNTMAYDVTIHDAQGNEIEPDPNCPVSVEFKFGTAAVPADAAAAETMSIIHVVEDENGEIYNLADVNAQAAVVGEQVEASFEVESFSRFVITWVRDSNRNYFTVTFIYCNTNGDEITIEQLPESGTVDEDTSTIFFNGTESEYVPMLIDGLRFKGAYLDQALTQKVSYMTTGGAGLNAEIKFYDENGRATTYSYMDGWSGSEKKINVYLVYETAAVAPPVNPNKPSIGHSKTATRNDDGTYDITLDVSGAVDTANGKKKLDVLFILDKSGSMDYALGSSLKSRMELVKEAVTSFTDKLSGNPNLDVYYDVVEFSEYGTYGNIGTVVGWTTNKDTVNQKVKAISAGGGTNYQGGIYQGIEELKGARSDAERVVIFLTDGSPSLRGLNAAEETGNGNNDNGGPNMHRPGTSLPGANRNAAAEQIQGLSCNQFYAIGVGNDFTGNGEGNIKALTLNVGRAEGATRPTISEARFVKKTSELTDIFEQIAANNNKFEISSVMITDELSTNIDPVEGEPLEIKITDKDGKAANVTSENVNGVITVTLPTSELNPTAKTVTASLDANDKVVMDFEDGYKLEAGWTYSVTVKVKPSQEAYDKFAKNGYTDKGEEGTGTHEGKEGLFSNGKAELKYKYNDDPVEPPLDYPKPVIQLDPGTLVIRKTITGLTAEEVKTLKGTLSFKVTLVDTDKKTVKKTYTLADFTPATGTAEGEFVYEMKIEGLAPDTTYTVVEEGYDFGEYQITPVYTNESGKIEAKKTATAEIRNDYGEEPTYSLKITKILEKFNSKMGDDASFLFKVTGPDGKEYSRLIHFNAAGTASAELITDLPGGTYTVTEMSAVGYKATSDMTQTITLNESTPDGIGEVPFSNTTTGGPYGDSSSAKNVLTWNGSSWSVALDNNDGNTND